MVTERQIEANRRNGARGKGPSEQGKARSRLNSTKHGLAGEPATVEAALSPEFRERRAKWSAEYSPVGEAGGWALDRAVAASFRIERCERAMEELVKTTRERAKLAWDEDRALEAASSAARLARDPVLASRQLSTTHAGVELLLAFWSRLLEALGTPGGWSESDESTALDLLGIPTDLRSGWTPIDGPEGSDLTTFRQGLAHEEIARLEALRDDTLAPLDELERRQAMTGDVALLSKPAKLILRYERDAWRRYREAIRELEAGAADPAPISQTSRSEPPSRPVRRPEPPPTRETPTPVEPAGRPAVEPARSFEEERRALLAEVELVQSALEDPSSTLTGADEDAWLDDLEKRFDLLHSGRSSTTPFSFVPITVGTRASIG
jgi:hypothetical protein